MTFQRQSFNITWLGHTLALGSKTCIMGVLNVTPDSFTDGGIYVEQDRAVERGIAMVHQGADIVDVGGESTRPYARQITAEEEMDRVLPVIESLKNEIQVPISIDTFKADVAKAALKAGASIINDVSALRFDPKMGSVAAEAEVPLILMHMKGTPRNMQDNPSYGDVIEEVMVFLRDALDRAVEGGVRQEMVIVDPGIGFGKTFNHNLEIIKELGRFSSLQCPLLLGSSRKAFIGHILNKEAQERDVGSMATVTAGILNGAHIIRVHNVEMAADTVKVADAICSGRVPMLTT